MIHTGKFQNIISMVCQSGTLNIKKLETLFSNKTLQNLKIVILETFTSLNLVFFSKQTWLSLDHPFTICQLIPKLDALN